MVLPSHGDSSRIDDPTPRTLWESTACEGPVNGPRSLGKQVDWNLGSVLKGLDRRALWVFVFFLEVGNKLLWKLNTHPGQEEGQGGE